MKILPEKYGRIATIDCLTNGAVGTTTATPIQNQILKNFSIYPIITQEPHNLRLREVFLDFYHHRQNHRASASLVVEKLSDLVAD